MNLHGMKVCNPTTSQEHLWRMPPSFCLVLSMTVWPNPLILPEMVVAWLAGLVWPHSLCIPWHRLINGISLFLVVKLSFFWFEGQSGEKSNHRWTHQLNQWASNPPRGQNICTNWFKQTLSTWERGPTAAPFFTSCQILFLSQETQPPWTPKGPGNWFDYQINSLLCLVWKLIMSQVDWKYHCLELLVTKIIVTCHKEGFCHMYGVTVFMDYGQKFDQWSFVGIQSGTLSGWRLNVQLWLLPTWSPPGGMWTVM